MPANHINTFFLALSDCTKKSEFVKLTLSNRRNKTSELLNVFVKPVLLKSGFNLSFVYRYQTKDVTKNYKPEEAISIVSTLLEQDFYKADLFTIEKDFHLTITPSSKTALAQKPTSIAKPPSTDHNREKKRYVKTETNIYLRELGITTAEGKVKSDRQDKFRQINKYIEIIEQIITQASLPTDFRIADMGAGKGYLTFALYDYLTHSLNLSPKVTGIEQRSNLVDTCNKIAEKAGFKNLNFVTGAINTTHLPQIDMLIALHACDTATDEAIYMGICAKAQVIICAPCCHKQIRKELNTVFPLNTITQYGILEERQSEILTDTIRAQILEAYGYKTKVFEFISTEHTPKNILIVGIKNKPVVKPHQPVLKKISELKSMFGISQHHLEKLLSL